MTFPRLFGPITGDLEGDLAILLLAVALIVALRAVDASRARNSRLASLAVGVALAGVAAALFIDATNAPNPQYLNAPVDAARAAQGKTVYDHFCAACHGTTGHGDGPAAPGLRIRPVDLTVHVFQHDETYLAQAISGGMPAMPAFKERLTSEQIADVIEYMRLLGHQAR